MKLFCAFHGEVDSEKHGLINHCEECGKPSTYRLCGLCEFKWKEKRMCEEGMCDCRKGIFGMFKRECNFKKEIAING